MKTYLLMFSMLACLSNSYAQYAGPSIAPGNVRALLADGKDDMPVNLQGRIVRHMGSDKYRFADSTGEITLEIDAKIWPANTPVDDKTEVRVHGEYDKSLIGEPEVEVTRIEKLQ
jgi:uncharacterized protein (TIGR00156 family)